MANDKTAIGGSELVVVSAMDDDSLIKEISKLIDFINRIPDARLMDIAYTCSLAHGDSVLAIVASTPQELRERLSSARSRIRLGATRIKDKSGTYYFRSHLLGGGAGKLAFVYPGAISFFPDMMKELVILNPECRKAFDELEEAMKDEIDFTPSNFIFPPAAYYRHDADIFSSGAYSQAFVSAFSGCVAMSRLLSGCEIEPEGVVGLGGGELAAALKARCTGNDVARQDRIKIIKEIYKLIKNAVDHGGLPSAIVALVILRSNDSIEEMIRSFPPDKAILTIDLSPRMKAYAVAGDYWDEFSSALGKNGARVMKLDLERPFNTPICSSLAAAVRKFSTGWIKKEPSLEIYSCASAEKISGSPRVIRNEMADSWTSPVRFRETILKMYEDGYRVFLEVGPRGLMTSSVEHTLSGKTFAAIATNSIHRRGLLQMQHALGQLAALGCKLDTSLSYVRRRCRKLDFNAVLSLEVRRDAELRLSRVLPRMQFKDGELPVVSYMGEPKGRGAKAAARAAAKAAMEGLQLQFSSGTSEPLISDVPPTENTPGVSYAFTKVFKLTEMPFVADFAFGNSQISYSDPNLRGLVLLPIPVATEIMAETATRVVPSRFLLSVENFICRRRVSFERGELKLSVRAERIAAFNPETIAVKVQIREDAPDANFTWPLIEANFIFGKKNLPPVPISVRRLGRPRSVHWSGRDIYPSKLGFGRRLRGIIFAENWGEGGIDYTIEVPPASGNVTFTRMPLWVVNPLLMQIAVSGFPLWRSHDKFPGAFSFPFRFRRMDLHGLMPKEGLHLNGYLRLTGVTPRSTICDITVTGGDGNVIMLIEGWEEITERVPKEFCDIVLQPATNFVSENVGNDFLGDPATDVASAVITDVPYQIFERNEELWLRILGDVVLCASERHDLTEMKGSVSRRTEWLFGRIAAKEAVRRYLMKYHQARWSYADVQIWPNEDGKPQAIGAWGDNLTTKLDVAIAHTSQFVIAIAAANARVGVDVESSSRNLSEEFAAGVFVPEELELAAKAAKASQAIIKFWCAKEAVSKALGTGIRYSPKEMIVHDYIADSGKLVMRLEGGWAEAFKTFKGRDINVTVRTMRDHALAFCFIPSILFDEK